MNLPNIDIDMNFCCGITVLIEYITRRILNIVIRQCQIKTPTKLSINSKDIESKIVKNNELLYTFRKCFHKTQKTTNKKYKYKIKFYHRKKTVEMIHIFWNKR